MPTIDSPVLVDSSTGETLDAGDGEVILAEQSSYEATGVIIDDFRMWAAVPAELDATARARRELSDGEAAGALLYLKFSEGTGATAFDSGPSARNATLVATTQWVGFEGTPDLAGVRKPMRWGIRRMRQGVLSDSQRVVFDLNNGPTQSITPRQNGYPAFSYDGDFTNIYDWTPVAGHYATQLNKGRVRFNSLPSGTLAFDVEGDVDPVHGYSSITAEIMRNIVAAHMPEVDVDLSTVAGVALARPDAVGIDAVTNPVTVTDLLNRLALGVDGTWTASLVGEFMILLRAEPGEPEFTLTVDDLDEDGLQKVSSSTVARQWTLSYRDFEVVVPAASLAGALTADERDQYTKSNRYALSADLGADAAWLRRYKDAIFATGATLYDDAGAVRREADRRLALDRYRREVYAAPRQNGLFRHRIGQSGRIVFPRFNLGAGNNYVVGGMDAVAETGAVQLYLWGRKVEP